MQRTSQVRCTYVSTCSPSKGASTCQSNSRIGPDLGAAARMSSEAWLRLGDTRHRSGEMMEERIMGRLDIWMSGRLEDKESPTISQFPNEAIHQLTSSLASLPVFQPSNHPAFQPPKEKPPMSDPRIQKLAQVLVHSRAGSDAPIRPFTAAARWTALSSPLRPARW